MIWCEIRREEIERKGERGERFKLTKGGWAFAPRKGNERKSEENVNGGLDSVSNCVTTLYGIYIMFKIIAQRKKMHDCMHQWCRSPASFQIKIKIFCSRTPHGACPVSDL